MKFQNKQLVLICAFSLTALIGCTENPFSDPPEVGTSQLSGKVLLSHDFDNSGVYVWIEQIEVSAYTNSDGDFLITIPPPSIQGGGGGIEGDLIMYFYLANYKLDSAQVSFLRGVPVVSKGDLNEEGDVARIIKLSKLLNVELSFLKKSISMSSIDSLRIKITLTSPEIEPVASVMAKANTREYTPPSPAFFISKIDSEEDIFKMNDIGYHVELVNFINKGVTVKYDMAVGFSAGELPTGTYEVIPFVKVRNVNPPLALLNSLGEHVLEYHSDYLKLPFKRSSEKIILTD
ncbi:hypothetical protein E3V55_04760 [Candidatus Marinimicrobia bacterium MT.SAG.3]|nr:hypothetical protein E3V55_04760 [Candidatus Marinimicrobia bacterium MT.SAG.3]